jgi:hypothetical protein
MKYIFSDKKTREKRKAGLAKYPCFALNIRNRVRRRATFAQEPSFLFDLDRYPG